jgi:hypothetical protein
MTRPQSALLVLFAMLLPLAVLAADADPLDGSLVSVVAVGGFTPYNQVRYDIVWRSGTAVATHYRSLINYDESLHALSLVRRKRYEQLLKAVRSAGAWSLPDAPKPAISMAGIRYEVEVVYGGKAHRFVVHDPNAQADPRYAQIIDHVRSEVVALAGSLPFRNVFFEPGTYGYLNLTTVPVAKVFINDRSIGHETPLYGYELTVGNHKLRLESAQKKGGFVREHTVKISPGMTTILHMDLR